MPAPWSPANQILPIVRTHRITFSGIRPTHLLETDIDGDGATLAANLRRSASDSAHRVPTVTTTTHMTVIQHLCGQSQPSSASAANQSSSSSLVEVREI